MNLRILDAKGTAELLRKRREAVCMTQVEVADLLRVTQQSVHNWEYGKSMPSLGRMVELSALYKCKVDDLIATQI